MAGLAEMGNRTFYAMRHKIIEPTVLLENGSEGNSIQADGTNSDGGSVKKLPGQTLTSGGSKTESLVPCLSQRLINGKKRAHPKNYVIHREYEHSIVHLHSKGPVLESPCIAW